MLRILGSPRSLCDGVARREFLQVGALSVLGLGLADWLHAQETRKLASPAGGSGRAKACILLYLYGSPSQLETFDVKPNAPSGIRGELGSIATAIPGYRVGELLPQTAQVIDRNGWLHTSDLGFVGEDGNLRLAGRVTEMYIRGGYNVYPAEVEAVLGELPGIAQVAVVGAPDAVLGEIGAAFVVPAGAGPPPELDALRSECRARLADYKAPDRLHLVAELPLTAMAKIDKRELAARAAELETQRVKERVTT